MIRVMARTSWPGFLMAVGVNWAAIAMDLTSTRYVLFVVALSLVAFGAAGMGANMASGRRKDEIREPAAASKPRPKKGQR